MLHGLTVQRICIRNTHNFLAHVMSLPQTQCYTRWLEIPQYMDQMLQEMIIIWIFTAYLMSTIFYWRTMNNSLRVSYTQSHPFTYRLMPFMITYILPRSASSNRSLITVEKCQISPTCLESYAGDN